jgi:hypothetical protein
MKIKPAFLFYFILFFLNYRCFCIGFFFFSLQVSIEVVGDGGTTFCKLPLLLNQEMLFSVTR